MESATRGSLARFLTLTRPFAVLKRTCVPSKSTHTGVTCGAPSGPTVASCANAFFVKRSRYCSGIVAMLSWSTIQQAVSIPLDARPAAGPDEHRVREEQAALAARRRRPDRQVAPVVERGREGGGPADGRLLGLAQQRGARRDRHSSSSPICRPPEPPPGTALSSAATEAIFGCEPRELSLLYERNFDTAGGAQESRFVGGAQTVALPVAAQLGQRVVLSAPVRRITQSSSGVTVVSDRFNVTGQRVIVAIPPTLAGRIDYQPPLPPLRDQLVQHMPQGSLMKFEAIYTTPFWRAKGLSGQAVSEIGPIKVTFDTSPADGSLGIMMGFIGGHEARVWENRSEDDLRAAALQNLAIYFGNEALNPLDVVTFNWSTEVWNRGCPVAVLGPGTLIDFGTALRTPVGRIHWAGTETSTFWNGYMDGAVRSGERAAQEVLTAL